MIDKQVDFWEVSTMISDFEKFLRFERQLAEATICNYIRTVREFNLFIKKDLIETSKEDIRAFLMALNQRGLAHARIGNYITGLRSYFTWFVYITKNERVREVNFFLSEIMRR